VALKGSQTEKNLEAAFAEESQACNAYRYYAQAAKKVGHHSIADIFFEIAQNEEEHAKTHFEWLGRVKDTRTNLEIVTRRESYEGTKMYPEFAQRAREEGLPEIGDCFERMSKIEAKHEEICLKLLKYWDEKINPKERTIGHSSVTIAQLMLPHQANPAGYAHGGEIMKMMDNAGGVVAARHAHTNVVTARVDDINFLKPVRVGDLVLVHACLTFVGHSSMEIRIEVETEDLAKEEKQKALTANFIYVALDRNGKPTPVAPLLITTEEGERLFEEGRKRYEARKKSSERF
jgi:acyl-CoA hydrolase/rubrerythrin